MAADGFRCERCEDAKVYRSGGLIYACDCFVHGGRGKHAVIPGVDPSAVVDKVATQKAKAWIDALRPEQRAAILIGGDASGRRRLAHRVASATGEFRYADLQQVCPIPMFDQGDIGAKWGNVHEPSLKRHQTMAIEVSPVLRQFQVISLGLLLADAANRGRWVVLLGSVPGRPSRDVEEWGRVHDELRRLHCECVEVETP